MTQEEGGGLATMKSTNRPFDGIPCAYRGGRQRICSHGGGTYANVTTPAQSYVRADVEALRSGGQHCGWTCQPTHQISP